MHSPWYHHAVIYQIDPSLFCDGNGDGMGDLAGITQRLPYLRGLGITCLWIMPFYTSPFRDGGYDVTDHLDVDPRFGTLADVVDLLESADELGMRVIIDLVVHHTSDQHPWFQAARKDRNSPYRDYYVWSDNDDEGDLKPIFPTVEDSVWEWDDKAGQYYRHIFYKHQPDLNLANPHVRHEMYKIMQFWLRLGVAGFRIDAASHMLERARAADPRDDGFWLLTDMHHFAQSRRSDAVLFGEVDVSPEEYADYFGDGDRVTLLSNFWLNNHLFLALARNNAEPLARALQEQPEPPLGRQYASWIRNHDELDLERLTDEEREEVMNCFAPDPDMRVYERGIRRRLPPMLNGNQDRIAMTHAILMSLPGTPIIRYGEEIGMGDDLSLPERLAVRTAMQWSDEPHAGFSYAPADCLQVPLIASGDYGYHTINVAAQILEDHSLLDRIGKITRARLGLRSLGEGHHRVLDVGCESVFALEHISEDQHEAVITLANLSPDDVHISARDLNWRSMTEMLSDARYDHLDPKAKTLLLRGYGYRWLRRRLRYNASAD